MPAIVDAHKHLAVTRDALVDQLQHLAYYGIGAAMSLGQDTGDVAYQVRSETIPMPRGSARPVAASQRRSRGARKLLLGH